VISTNIYIYIYKIVDYSIKFVYFLSKLICFSILIVFRELIEQAIKEKRMLLTRDAKLLRYEYLIKNQIYRVKSLLKNEQLLEVCL
jgi:hypothetical protein